jgi:thiol:disulfide interchange protein DsbC
MKNRFLLIGAGLLIAHLSVAAVIVFAAEDVDLPTTLSKAILEKRFPKMEITSVAPTQVNGIFEVVAGPNVFYFDPKTSTLIFGEMWDANGKNLTVPAREKIASGKFEVFAKGLDKAIKIGSGKHQVVEIIDPDCPFCRKMDEFWKTRADVTRYVFLLPLPSLHPQSQTKVDYIISSANPQQALEDAITGKFDKEPVPEVKRNVAKIKDVAAVVAASHISGTPAYFIDGHFISGANQKQILALLK